MDVQQGTPVVMPSAPMPREAASPPGRAAGFAVPSPTVPRTRKGGPRPVPERTATFAHLNLDGLRHYRQALGEEEGRVSYWRRILQARLDLLRAGLDGGSARAVDTDALRPVLTDARVGAGRAALLDIVPADIPPLPQIEDLWERQVDLSDLAAARRLESDLADAERQLSDYRAALHQRIAEATGELIARYREQPSLCLSALPLPPGRRVAIG
jgi:hypothetical protein